MERKVIVIVGPTCSGKTTLSLLVAKELGSEIISADSRQFYKYLNIGTAKVTGTGQKNIKHHFVDFIEPNEEYNVSKFEYDSLKVIESLLNESIVPIVVGGSGLYIKAIIDGIFNTADTDNEYRTQLMELRDKFGNEYIYKKLRQIDPGSAEKMLSQNWKRVIRALEVYHLTGRTMQHLQEEYKRDKDLNFLQFGIEWERDTLYKNIEERVDNMIDIGLIDEVKKILEMGYDKSLNSLNTVGYKEIISYLENEITKERAIQLIKRNTRRYAKRQLTWFRKDERIEWIKINEQHDLEKIAEFIINKVLSN